MLDLLLPRSNAGQVTVGGDYGWSGFGIGSQSRTRSGVTIDEEIALTYEAVFRATCVLAEGVGGVPLPCYERVKESDRQIADIEVANLLKFQPNPSMMAGVARERGVAHQVNWGNGFFEIERYPGSDRVRYLWPIHPSRVIPSRDPDYDYEVRSNAGGTVKLHAYEVLHIPGALSEDGIWGRGVVCTGRETIGGALRVERSSYRSTGQPKGILEAPGMNDREKRREYRKEWESVHDTDADAPTLAILGPGSKYTALGGLSAEQNQLVQARAFNKSNVATLYGIPAYKLGAEGKETAGTIEQKAIEFVVYSLLPWARKWEEQCNFKLLTPDQWSKFYFEHNFAALLRGDIGARYTAYRIGISTGFLTINQVCRLENLPSIGLAGDQHFIPANLTTAERALEGDFGNGGAVGSDTTGSPADSPNDRDGEAAFAKLVKSVTTHAQRAEMDQQLKQLESRLPERSMEWKSVAKQVLRDAIKGIMVRESNAIKQAAKGSEFDEKMREFYASHKQVTTENLSTACSALRLAGINKDRADLVDWLAARSLRDASEAYNTDTRDVFANRLAAWPTERTDQLVDEILGDEHAR